ncbi:hypothetical protein EYR40_010785 [Pleurotus pulmonarius]|nr:hypothetical protein EYR36_002556 [Pleurotus pulmonarius]KAF4586769.1 hypothetical protein EYR40_010785 [Pleurotus pulmonarius]
MNNTTANNTSYPPSSACSPSPAPVPSTQPPRTPTNDDIEAIIQMATSNTSRNTPDGRGGPGGPPRDTRTQLFVGNLPYRVRWQDLKDLFRKAGTVLRADVSLGPDNRSRGYGTVLLATAEDAGRAVDMYNGYDWQTRVLEVRPDRLPQGNRDYAGADIPRDEFEYGQSAPPSVVQPSITTSAASAFPAHVQPPLMMHARTVQSPSSHPPLHLHSRSISNSILEQALLDKSIFDLEQRPGTSGAIGVRSHSGLGGVLASNRDVVNSSGFAIGLGGNPPNRTLFVGNLPFHVQWQDLKDLFRLSGPVLRADVALAADGRSRGFGTVVFRTEEEAERARRSFDGYDFNGRTLKVHFDKFSQSQAALGPPPFDLSLPADSMARNSSLLSANTSLLDDYHMGNDFPRSYAEDIDLFQNKMMSTPVSPMAQESAHVSPSPGHSRAFSNSSALPPLSSSLQQQPFAYTHSLPPSQPYSPIHQHTFAASSSSSLVQSLTQSPLAQSMQAYPHQNASRVSAAHQQRTIQPTSLSLPESLAPTSYPSPSPQMNTLAEMIASASGSSAGSLLDKLPKSVSGMSALSGSESESLLSTFQERERRAARERDTDLVGYESLLQERARAHLLPGYDPDNSAYAEQSHSWDRQWGKRREGDLEWENAEGRGRALSGRERSTSRRDETTGLDIDDLMQSLALTRGAAESAERGSGMLDKGGTLASNQGNHASNYSSRAATREGYRDRDSSVHSTARRPSLVAGTGSGKASGTSTSSWSPASTTASRSVSGTGSSGGVSSTAPSSFTSDQRSPQHVQSTPAPHQDEDNTSSYEANSKPALDATEEGMRRRATDDAVGRKPNPPKIPHSRSQPEPMSLAKTAQDATQPSSPPQAKTQHNNTHRRPNVRSPRHTQSPTQTQQQAQQQHPHHPGPIVLPPPVTSFPILPPHTLSPHGMMVPVGMGSPLHHPGSPTYHPGATPTNANSSMGMAATTGDMSANSNYGYVGSGAYPGHGLHPSVVPMTPHGLPPITPSMPPFTFLPQPSPIHHHPENSSSIHYPHASVMSMGMGGMTLGNLPSPSQATFTPTTMGPSSPHHIVPTHIQQSYQHATHPAVHHHMMSSFSPGIAISPGSVYRPGGQGNPFINPAVGAPVHMHVHGGHPQAMHSPGAMGMYGYGGGSFSPGEITLGQEPAGYFDNVYQMPVYYGPIGPAPGPSGSTNDSVEREIMKTREEGGSGRGERDNSGAGQAAGEGGAPQQDLVESPDEVAEGEGGTKPSRTYSLSSKRPEGLAFLHRSDSDPSVKTPGAGPGSGVVTEQ